MLIRWRILRIMSRLRPRKQKEEKEPSLLEQLLEEMRHGALDVIPIAYTPPKASILLRSPHCYTSQCGLLRAFANRLLSKGYELSIEIQRQVKGQPDCQRCIFHQKEDQQKTPAESPRPPVELS